MLVSPCVYFKLVLSLFEAAGVSYFASENDACAVHEIEHDIFKFWHEFFVVDNIVVDLVVGRYVDSDVAFDIVKRPFMVQCFIQCPKRLSFSLIKYSLEKQHFAGASCHQACFLDQKHGAQILIDDLLNLNLWLLRFDVIWIKVYPD